MVKDMTKEVFRKYMTNGKEIMIQLKKMVKLEEEFMKNIRK